MTRGIDHLVINVRRLEAAVSRYKALGFTITPRAVHPFGTANHLVQLRGNFLELVTVVNDAAIVPPKVGQFSFGAFCRNYQEKRDGMSMLVFHSDDARADQAEFISSGLNTYAPFDFSRKATLPDGSQVTVGFSLAFVTHPAMPEAAFFCCQQHAPQHFWREEYQTHPNGAEFVSKVYMVADKPASLQGFFRAMHSADNVLLRGDELRIRTALGQISVIRPADFLNRFPRAHVVGAPTTPHFAGFQVKVVSLDRVKQILKTNSVVFMQRSASVYVRPTHAFGLVIEFRQ
ncbi:MAG: VOC family protein [Gammaproteobacteria bacterium]|nr:VOC family protein [Gammaproteobacteria bacterium]